MISFWETKHFTQYDFIIIGSGLTGLSLAAEIKENNPLKSVLVLERGLFPSGASTKNAGFACFGSVSELISDIDLIGESTVVEMVKNRVNGLSILRNRLTDKHLDFKPFGGYELIFNEGNTDWNYNLNRLNKLLKDFFKSNVFSFTPHLVNEFGFNKAVVKSLIFNPFEAQIDTGLMMKSLIEYVSRLGVKIITGPDVVNYSIINNNVELEVKSVNGVASIFKASKVAFCTNAFTKQFFPNLEIIPGRGQVLVTKPIDNLKIKGTFHFDDGYYYFRNFNDRIIFGGGRNLDFENEKTLEFGNTNLIQDRLKKYLEEVIIPGVNFEIDQKWSGIMAFGHNKQPIIEKINDNIFVGARLNGMGVAISSNVAKQLAEKML
jgi:glycine/D-amino acid oxidase-like deaminating enzyme